ncbi:Queuine tRNA-ribosyltransferase subunit qtrtd1 [Mortierella alpina]|nr:Queuine tRNA-ribosyltransferase subunit qtrtd1 [Mortierella alpina]
MSPLSFNIIRQSTQLSAARRATVVLTQTTGVQSAADKDQQDASTRRVIETPGCLMYSVKGSVPHLTPDTLRLQGFGGVHVSIEHILQEHQPAGLEKWPFSLPKFLNLQDLIVFCDIRDPSRYHKVPFNSDRHVSMVTHQGVRQLTLEEYLKVIRAYQPDIVATFADTISDLDQTQSGKLNGTGCGQKRVRKSVERNLKWLDQILKERQGIDALAEDRALEVARKKIKSDSSLSSKGCADSKENLKSAMDQMTQDTQRLDLSPARKPWRGVSVFAHVVGAQLEQERIRSAQETAKREGVDGFIIDMKTVPGSRDEVFRSLKTSIDHLPAEKPRLVYGMQTPEDVLRSIALGADLFDTSYPSHLTEDGKASLFSFGPSATMAPTNSNTGLTTSRWINLWDEEHADKFVPLQEGCECYACKGGRHTRAYINHLLKAHEMLATVLLMSHNMHQYSQFFAEVRQSIQDGTFEQQSALFVERFGAEPEHTGGLHAAQAVVEASLSKWNRLDGDESEREAAAEAASIAKEERLKAKELRRRERRERNRAEGLQKKANKMESLRKQLETEHSQEKETTMP